MNSSKQPSSKPKKRQPIWLSEMVLERSESLLHIIGYIFLIFAALDYLIILIPPQFTNPVWEFQTMGQLVERSAIPIIGLVLVFYRPEQAVDRWELHLLKIISWIGLLIGILYLMMLPLGIRNTFRIHQANNRQLNARISQQSQQLQQRQAQFNQLSEAQLQNLFDSLPRPESGPTIETPAEFREQVLNQIQSNQENLRTQGEVVRQNQKMNLVKSSVKLNVGALLSGVAFMVIWNLTRWVRIIRYHIRDE
ncbi:MAG: HpsJ family protein [Hormoscilla sp.]